LTINVSIKDVLMLNWFHEKIKAVFYANGLWLNKINNVALWFLPSLFVVQNIFYGILKFSKKTPLVLSSLIIISIFSYIAGLFIKESLPWSVDSSLTAAVFFGAGYFFRNLREEDFPALKKKKFKFIIFFLSLISSLAISTFNGRIDMNTNVYGNHIFFYIAAFSGIISHIFLSKKLSFRILYFLGSNSLIIFGLHLLLVGLVVNNLDSFVELFTKEDIIMNTNLYSFIKASLTIIYTIPIILILNKFFPMLIGRKIKKNI
jgi:hypothetical protein